MLATTIQITNNPPHTTHTQKKIPFKLAAQATTTNTGSGRSHGVEREPDSVLESPPPPNSSRETFYTQPKNAPTPTTHNPGSKHMQAQENNQHNPTGHAALSPTKLGSLERR